MSTKRQIRQERARREREQRRKKGPKPLKVLLLFLLAISLLFAGMAIFGDSTRTRDGRVWSAAHQHWH